MSDLTEKIGQTLSKLRTLKSRKDTGSVNRLRTLELEAVAETPQSGVDPQQWRRISAVTIGCASAVLLWSVFTAFIGTSHLRSGAAMLDKGQMQDAVDDLSVAISRNNKLPHVYLKRAIAYAGLGLTDEAILDFTEAIRLDNKLWQAYLGRAAQYFKTSDFEKCEADCGKVLQLQPENQEAHVLKVAADTKARRFSAIVDQPTEWQTKIKDQPTRVKVLLQLGDACLSMAELTKAVTFLSEALKLSPHDGTIRLKRAQAYARLERWPEAQADIAESKKWLKNGDVFRLEADCYAHAGETAKAIQSYARAIAAAPMMPQLYLERAALYEKNSEFQNAAKDLKIAMSLEPGNKALKERYAAMCLRAGKRAPLRVVSDSEVSSNETSSATTAAPTAGVQGLAQLLSASQAKPQDANARRSLAHALVQSRRYSEAIDQFNFLFSMQKPQPADLLPFATSLQQTGRLDKAISTFNDYLKSNPNDVKTRIALVETYKAANRSADALAAATDAYNRASVPTDKVRLQMEIQRLKGGR